MTALAQPAHIPVDRRGDQRLGAVTVREGISIVSASRDRVKLIEVQEAATERIANARRDGRWRGKVHDRAGGRSRELLPWAGESDRHT